MHRFAATFISFLVLFGVAANGFDLVDLGGLDSRTQHDIPELQRRVLDPQRRDIPAAEYSVPIAGTVPRSRKDLQYLRETRGFTPSLAGSNFDQSYFVNVTIGGELFRLIVYTGR